MPNEFSDLSTLEVVGKVLITALTMLIGRYISDMSTLALAEYMPQSNKNKILFNILLIIIWFLIVIAISYFA